jgi:hypothetical protein
VQGCVPGACADGTKRCNERYLEVCTQGRWEHIDRCATPELCDHTLDACKPPICGDGPTYFGCRTPSIIQVCEPGRDRYRDYLSCTGMLKCIEGSGTCG